MTQTMHLPLPGIDSRSTVILGECVTHMAPMADSCPHDDTKDVDMNM